jgi:hypothetical protein
MWKELPLRVPGRIQPQKSALLNKGTPLKSTKKQGTRKCVSICGSEECFGWTGHILT